MFKRLILDELFLKISSEIYLLRINKCFQMTSKAF